MRDWIVAFVALVAVACGSSASTGGGGGAAPERDAVRKGQPQVRVVVSPSAPLEVYEAAAELSHALSEITGVQFPEPTQTVDGPERIRVLVGSGVGADDPAVSSGLTAQAYRIATTARGKNWTIELRGGSPAATQWAVYDFIQRLGVRYLHPEDTFYPRRDGFQLPLPMDVYERADLPLRGFHHDTRLPIPFADLLLQGREADRPYLDRYLLWLVRNRQNLHQLELLESVELGRWIPFISQHIDRAHGLGIEVAVTLAFTDERRGVYRLIRDPEVDFTSQITAGLDAVLAAPFDRVVLRLDASPLSAQPDDIVLSWIAAARAHVEAAHPYADVVVRVEPTTTVPVELLSPPDGAALAVTTGMVWGLDGPAPALGGESYEGQRARLEAGSGAGRAIFAPDTAWGRGVDADVPLVLPLIGWSRAADSAALADLELLGQVTTSRGDAWGYWLWDLAAARYAWEDATSFDAFLQWLAPVLGPYKSVLATWAELQRKALFEENPRLLYYVAGERPADEVGKLFGPAERPVRPLLSEVMAYDEEAYAAWLVSDYDPLVALRAELAGPLATLPEPVEPSWGDDPESTPARIQRELDNALRLTLLRFDQVIAHYAVVGVLRAGGGQEQIDDAVDALEDAARDAVQAAQKRVTAGEALYRYPAGLLFGKRVELDLEGNPVDLPLPLTTLERGYLDPTHELSYWDRREEALDTFLASQGTGGGFSQKWSKAPALVLAVGAGGLTLTLPDTPGGADLLRPLLPPLLIGVHSWPQEVGGSVDITIATDRDGNGKPDNATQEHIDDGVHDPGENTTTLQAKSLAAPVRDSTGQAIGQIELAPATLTLKPKHIGGVIQDILAGELTGELDVEQAADLMATLSGGDLDIAGARRLLAVVLGVGPGALPARFEIRVALVGFVEVP